MTEVSVVLALTTVRGRVLKARIAQVLSRVTAERALIGFEVESIMDGFVLPGLPLRPGVLVKALIPLEIVDKALDQIAEGAPPKLEIPSTSLRCMTEPCARVPLSLLRELRGQEATTEMARRALVKVWAEDRKTGTFE